MSKSNVKNIFHIISRVGLSECSQTTWYSSFPIAPSFTMSAHNRESERQNIIDKMHTWQQCLVIISEDILKTKYDFYLRYIAPQCWLNDIDNDTNPATLDHPPKKALCLPTSIPGSDSDASWWMVQKVDPHYDAYRRQKSSIRSCIGHKYVYAYEVGCRVVALKSWYLYFLPDTPETTFMNESLRSLLLVDAFTVHGPPWRGLGPVSISDRPR